MNINPGERIIGLGPSVFVSKGYVDPQCVFKDNLCEYKNTFFTIGLFYYS